VIFHIPSFVAHVLMDVTTNLERDGVHIENLTHDHYKDSISLVTNGSVAKEGIYDLLKILAEHPAMTAKEAAMQLNFVSMSGTEVENAVRAIVASKADLVRSKGERAAAPLMGLVMKELRGKADGGMVSAILKKEIQKMLDVITSNSAETHA
jgi:glutamyl-tRNA(Gln) amidotransferase subunit E